MYFKVKTRERLPYKEVALNCTRRYGGAVTVIRLFAIQSNAYHPLRLKPYGYVQKYQTQLYICRSTTSLCQGFFVVCVYMLINLDYF